MLPPRLEPAEQAQRKGTFPGITFRAGPPWLILYFISVAGAALAAISYNISSPFWLDETFTGAMACQPSFAAMMPLILHDAHPVLYHILVYVIFGVTGCHLWVIRGLSLAASLTAARLLLRHVSRQGGDVFVAAALLFANPTFWLYAFEARSYSLLFLAGTGVVVYGMSSDLRSRIKAIGFAMLGGALHYYASFLFAVLFVLVVSGDRKAARSYQFWGFFFAAGLLLIAYYAPQLPEELAYGNSLSWVPVPTLLDLVVVFPLRVFGSVPSAMIMIVLTIAIIGRRYKLRNQAFLLVVTFILFALCLFAASYLKPMFIYRYMHFLVPGLIAGLALLAGEIEKKGREKGGSDTIFSHQALLATSVFAFANCFNIIKFPPDSRAMGWEKAMASTSCTIAQPCGFVLDDPLLPSLDMAQYTALANFLAPVGGSIVALQPQDARAWIEKRPGEQLLYAESFRPSLKFGTIMNRVPLTCQDFRMNHIGTLSCRSSASSAQE